MVAASHSASCLSRTALPAVTFLPLLVTATTMAKKPDSLHYPETRSEHTAPP